MPAVLQVIQLLVAPVIMISACGLLCLALYNRLAAIVSRARTFHREWFEMQTHLDDEVEATTRARLEHRAAVLRDQVEQILRRARMVRNALQCLLLTVLSMLVCSLALGLTLTDEHLFSKIALGAFAMGVLAAMGAMILAMKELTHALDPVAIEGAGIDLLQQ